MQKYKVLGLYDTHAKVEDSGTEAYVQGGTEI